MCVNGRLKVSVGVKEVVEGWHHTESLGMVNTHFSLSFSLSWNDDQRRGKTKKRGVAVNERLMACIPTFLYTYIYAYTYTYTYTDSVYSHFSIYFSIRL